MDLFEDLPAPSSSEKLARDSTSSIEESDSIVKPTTSRKRQSADNDSDGPNRKKTASERVELQGFVAERKGEREEMQDAHVIIDDFSTFVNDDTQCSMSYYAVFDGHGGSRASKYAAQHLHKIIADKFPKDGERELKRCIVESFKKLDEDFLLEAKQKKPSWKDGSTAVAVLLVDNTIYIGNLGDSKATLCRYNSSTNKLQALPLTTDHSPTLYEERMRIQKAGGYVRDGRLMGVLEVSRSVGDGAFKMHGVSSTPDVKKCQLSANDRFIILACDGLWKRFDNESAIEFVDKILKDESLESTDSRSAEDVRYETACNRLANEAVRRLSADNVTVMLVAVKHSDS